MGSEAPWSPSGAPLGREGPRDLETDLARDGSIPSGASHARHYGVQNNLEPTHSAPCFVDFFLCCFQGEPGVGTKKSFTDPSLRARDTGLELCQIEPKISNAQPRQGLPVRRSLLGIPHLFVVSVWFPLQSPPSSCFPKKKRDTPTSPLGRRLISAPGDHAEGTSPPNLQARNREPNSGSIICIYIYILHLHPPWPLEMQCGLCIASKSAWGGFFEGSWGPVPLDLGELRSKPIASPSDPGLLGWDWPHSSPALGHRVISQASRMGSFF